MKLSPYFCMAGAALPPISHRTIVQHQDDGEPGKGKRQAPKCPVPKTRQAWMEGVEIEAPRVVCLKMSIS